MLATIALTYTLHVLSNLAWPGLDLTTCSREITKPGLIAISRSDSVAMIVSNNEPGLGSDSILLQRSDGRKERVWIPARRTLASAFTESSAPSSSGTFPNTYFTGTRLGDDDTLFATIRNSIEGGFQSVESSAFQWKGAGTWARISLENAMSLDNDGRPPDIEIAAAVTSHWAAFNGIYGNRFPPDPSLVSEPGYLENEVELLRGSRVISLGVGTATGINGATVVGFQAGLSIVEHSCHNPRRTYAVEWINGTLRRLGNGISYDVNRRNQIVGDNEIMFGTAGHPVLWIDGREVVLDRRPGSAYGISDDGTIVGQVGGKGFVADARRPNSRVLLLDGRLRDCKWHILTAYGVARTGRILAIGAQRQGPSHVVVLDPYEKH